jgi:hypothetical protein
MGMRSKQKRDMNKATRWDQNKGDRGGEKERTKRKQLSLFCLNFAWASARPS